MDSHQQRRVCDPGGLVTFCSCNKKGLSLPNSLMSVVARPPLTTMQS